MNKSRPSALAIGALALWAMSAIANPAEHAKQSRRSSGQASGHSAANADHSLLATGQLVTGLVAVPVLASGTVATGVGGSAQQVGGASMAAASRPIGQALPITEETLSILPSNQALQQPLPAKN